jgi:hypothetical protein
VAVVDLSQWKVQTLIDAGAGVDGLAWAAPASPVHNHLRAPIKKSAGE